MTGILIILSAIVVVISFFLTMSVIRDVNRKLNVYESTGDSLDEEVSRSHEYETKSLRINIKSLSWIYIVLCLAIIIVSVLFIIFG